MGSFRSASARTADIVTLTAADRPASLAPDTDVPRWLTGDEWVKYLTRLPHAAAKRLADEGTTTVLDSRKKRVKDVVIRAGTMAQIKLEEGIVDWYVLDENDKPVAWDKDRAGALIEGLPSAVRQHLMDRIGAGPAGADDEADEEDDGTGEKSGND